LLRCLACPPSRGNWSNGARGTPEFESVPAPSHGRGQGSNPLRSTTGFLEPVRIRFSAWTRAIALLTRFLHVDLKQTAMELAETAFVTDGLFTALAGRTGARHGRRNTQDPTCSAANRQRQRRTAFDVSAARPHFTSLRLTSRRGRRLSDAKIAHPHLT